MEERSRFILYFVLFTIIVGHVCSQGADNCRSRTTCRECIGVARCAWCSQENFGQSRCDTQDNLVNSGCPVSNISNPGSKFNNEEDSTVGPKVQVQPQRIKVNLRSGVATTVRLTVRPAENYPVDLYYLMDMSNSMKDDLGKLTALATTIADSINNITKSSKLGFGSFVDKTVSPFIRVETKLPCITSDKVTCVPTYGYRHILSLVDNAPLFAQKIKDQVISGNLDAPEGGFDALMQVAACEKEIGWGANGTSRRLVVFVSDAPFHIAGDGKLGGIVTPNDGKCHLKKDVQGDYDFYSKSNEMDYPSLAQLHDRLQQSNIIPIFAVVKDVSSLYQSVASMWSDLGAVSGELAVDSGNIVDLIARKYEEIVSSVSLVFNAPEKVSVTVKANCGPNAVNDQTQRCSNVKIGEKVYFDVSVTLQQCPEAGVAQQSSFTIRVPGFGAVELDLNYVCECDCGKPSMAEENSTKCTEGNGTFACGQCDCNKGRYGEFCQCDTPFDKSKDQSKCKSSNSTDELPCSGNGECACGKCVCKAEQGKRFYGDLCQCNDFSCPEDKGQLCGGPDRGVCRCRKCQCKPKYHGANCDKKNCTYFPPETQCKKDADSEICGGSERGECKPDDENCYKCVCKSAYDGTYCEKCPNCEDGMCSRNEDCALCATFEGQSLEQCKKINRCEANVLEVQVVDNIEKKTDEGLYRCEGEVDGCTYYFTTQTEENSERFVLFVQKEKVSCPEEAPILPIVLGVIGGILLLGLIILIVVKAFVTMVDRIEYQKFERERMHSRWTKEKNPLYQAAKTTFENPTYAGGRQ